MASKNVKPVNMWGWTDSRGSICVVGVPSTMCSAHLFGGTRIRVVVTPAKKPAKKRRAAK